MGKSRHNRQLYHADYVLRRRRVMLIASYYELSLAYFKVSGFRAFVVSKLPKYGCKI